MGTTYPKIGLALGSGGARGLSHIGVLQVLEKNNIPVHMVAGSSIGSLIGAHFAAFQNVQALEEFALSFNRRRGFTLFDPTMKGGLLKGQKIEKFIQDMLRGASFDTLSLPFAAVTTDFASGDTVVLTEGSLVKAIRASISVPGIFQPVTWEKKLLADGGLSNPVPVDVVRAMGADIVIAVNLDAHYVDDESDVSLSLSQMPFQSIRILRHHLAMYAVKSADVVIAPRVNQIGLIGWNYFFDTKRAQAIIAEGKKAAEDALPSLQRVLAPQAKPRSLSRIILQKLLHRWEKQT